MPERAEHVAKRPPSCSCIPDVMIHSILFHFYIYLFFKIPSLCARTVLSGVLKRRLAIQTRRRKDSTIYVLLRSLPSCDAFKWLVASSLIASLVIQSDFVFRRILGTICFIKKDNKTLRKVNAHVGVYVKQSFR